MSFYGVFQGRDGAIEFHHDARNVGTKQYRVNFHVKEGADPVSKFLMMDRGEMRIPQAEGFDTPELVFTENLLFAENLLATGTRFANRTVPVTVTMQLASGKWATEPDQILAGEIHNPPPGKCSVFLSASLNGANIYINPPADSFDLQGYLVWVKTTEGLDPETETPTFDTTTNLIPAIWDDMQPRYIYAAAYDSFGQTGLVISDVQSTVKKDIVVDVDLDAIKDSLDDWKQEVLDAVDGQTADVVASAYNAANGAVAGVVASVTAVADDLAAETIARELAISTLGDSTAGSLSTLNTKVTATEAKVTQQEQTIAQQGDSISSHNTRITNNANAITAETTRTNTLVASTKSDLQTSITNEATVRANADNATSTLVGNLTTKVDNNTAAIQTEATTRADAVSSLVQQIESISATGSLKATYVQATAPTGTDIIQDAIWFNTTTKRYHYRNPANTAWIENVDPQFGTLQTNITSEVTARTNADTALGGRIDTLTTTVNGNFASLTNADTALSNANSATASRATILEAQLAGTQASNLKASIDNTMTVATRADNGVTTVLAQAQLVATAGGKITGFKINSSAAESTFDILASRFRITDPNNANINFAPFEVVGGQVKMKEAAIGNLSASSIKVGVFNENMQLGSAGKIDLDGSIGRILIRD